MTMRNNQPHDVPQAPTQPSGTTQRVSVPVRKCHLSSQPPQAIPTAPPTHAPHGTENLFSIDRLFYGTHSRTTYNHSRIVNHFAMLSRTTTNRINLPQQKTFTYPQIVCTRLCHFSRNYFLTASRDEDPLDQGSSLLGNP